MCSYVMYASTLCPSLLYSLVSSLSSTSHYMFQPLSYADLSAFSNLDHPSHVSLCALIRFGIVLEITGDPPRGQAGDLTRLENALHDLRRAQSDSSR